MKQIHVVIEKYEEQKPGYLVAKFCPFQKSFFHALDYINACTTSHELSQANNQP